MLSAYPRSNSSYSAVAAYKHTSTHTQKPTSEEQVALIRTTMRRLEDARTGGKPAGYAKVHAAIADPAGPGVKVCAWVVAHDSQDRVKSSDSVARKARRESGSEQEQASRALDHATQMQKRRKDKEPQDKEAQERKRVRQEKTDEKKRKDAQKKAEKDEHTAAGWHENTAMHGVNDQGGHGGR